MGVKEIIMTTIEVGGSGDTAYELGKSKVRIQPEGQAATMDSTRYLVIWKRQAAGTWKVHVDFWSVSLPMPGQ
jgi:ketosteroid isomerase-like protein